MHRITFVFALILAVAASPFVYAQETVSSLLPEQVDIIRTNCVDAQPTFLRVQQSDKTSRINRGYEYEMLSRLMIAFNSRAALNRINSPELLSITSDFEKAFKAFSETYTLYDDSISKLVRYKCQESPEAFYTLLLEARAHRQELNRRIVEIDTLLERYQMNLNAIKKVVNNNEQ